MLTKVEVEERRMNRMSLRSSLFLGFITTMAIVPTVITLSMRKYFLDTNSIGRTTFIIQDLEIEHRRLDALLFKVQGFGKVDEEEIQSLAAASLEHCREATHAEWYSHDAKYDELRESIQKYCDVSKNRISLFDDYDRKTVSLEAAMVKMPPIVRAFDNDKNELWIEDTERLLIEYSIHPTHDSYLQIQRSIDALADSRYSLFRASATVVLNLARERSELVESLTDPAPLELLATAKKIHFEAVVSHDQKASLARELLTYVSLAFGLVLVFVYWRLQKTSAKLARLNECLEHKVAERTKELQDALEKLADQQAYIAQSAKMSALGEMAGGIAHEINTPLAAISLTAELLQAEAEEQSNPQLAEGLSTISTIVERISKIVQGLKRFSRGNDDVEHIAVPVSQVLDDTLLLCSEKLKARGIKLEITRDEKNTNILCAPEQIAQVLINLLNNSVDAVEGQVSARKWIRLETSNQDGVFMAKVTDGGDLIAPDVREKLMHPFFTTKQIGKGTGLGLSISKGIMLSHQGTLEFDARAQVTTFVLTMPSMTPAQAQQIMKPARTA